MYIDISISPTQGIMLFFSAPLIRSANLSANAKWIQNGVTIAGGNEYGNGMNQLYNPWGLCVDDNQTIYIADASNHRIVEWKYGATAGRVVAGGNGEGNRSNQFNSLRDVIIDKEKDSFIICDYGNKRIGLDKRNNIHRIENEIRTNRNKSNKYNCATKENKKMLPTLITMDPITAETSYTHPDIPEA
ncbi:unnamed protein product [Rotaria sp. Silwood1]|nr:unnamed protein product [Rotaria sp. Silwood1]